MKWKTHPILIIVAIFLLTTAGSVSGNTLNIPVDYPTIQAGMDAAQPGDTVLVAEGTYFENIHFHGKDVVLTSEFVLDGDMSHILNTIIDGSAATDPDTGSCVIFDGGETAGAILQGFTLTGGTGTTYYFPNGNGTYPFREGGGIMLHFSAATIRYNLIVDNQPTLAPGLLGTGGGGISSMYGDPTIINNVIARNTALYAAGIVLNWSGGTIRNNIVYANYDGSLYGCGGIMVWLSDPGTAILENNTIVGNISEDIAGGVLIEDNNTVATVRNNIVWGNLQDSGGQITGYGSTALEYNDIEESYPGNGNMSVYPDFVSNGFLLNPASPCIDAGSPAGMYDDPEDPDNPGQPSWPAMGDVQNDIGAYGGPNASILPDFYHEDVRLPGQIGFGIVAIGDSLTRSIELHNLSTTTMLLDNLTVSHPDEFSFPNAVADVRPIERRTLTLQWKPQQAGVLVDTLRIYHNLSTVTNPFEIILTGTAEGPDAVEDDPITQGSAWPWLHQNYPNPCVDHTTLAFTLPTKQSVTVRIHNTAGQVVRTLIENQSFPSGEHTTSWDGKNDSGDDVSTGIYLYQLQGDNYSHVKQLVLISSQR